MKVLLNNKIIIQNCKVAKTFFEKLFGRIFTKDTILLKNCNSVHTIFMKENSDIIFLNAENKIIKLYENTPPRCILFPIKEAVSILESNAGFIKSAKVVLGNILILEDE